MTQAEHNYFDREYFQLHRGKKGYVNFLANLLANYQAKGKVLDIGCGFGFFLEALDKGKYNTYGIDISEFAIEQAKQRSKAHLTVQSADERFPYRDDLFEAVTMFDVIEHISNYRYALEEIYRVLKPGGYAFVITANSNSLLRKILRKQWYWYKDPTHIHLFSPKSLRQSLMDTGFTSITIRTFFDFYLAGETSKYLRPFRPLNRILFLPKFGDAMLAIARK